MEINKQLFEDVLSGKLKGTFVFRNQLTCNSDELTRNTTDRYKSTHPYSIKNWSYTLSGMYHFCGESNVDIIDFIPDTNMKENELTIEIPNGKIVDWDESKKQNKIVLKDKQLTYEDICKKLFNNEHYTIAWEGYPIKCCAAIYNASNATTEHQLECILAKNKLATVAKYLNDGWKPSGYIFGWFICACGKELEIRDRNDYKFNNNIIFKTKKLAEKAIEILGKKTIELALEPLGI
jgi:hypothetical protein